MSALATPARAQIGVPYVADEPQPSSAGDAAQPGADTTSATPSGDLSPVVAEPAVAGHPPSFFYALWEERRAALDRDDEAAASRKLAELLEAKKRSGWPDLQIFSRALSIEAEQADQGARALELATAAAELAPHDVGASYSLMRAQWGEGEAIGAAKSMAHAVGLTFTEPPLFAIRLGNTLLTLLVGILLASISFVLLALVRYARLMVHDMRHLMPRGVRSWQAAIVGIALFVAPLLFRLGLAWCVLIWLLLVGLYLHRSERVAAVLVAASMAAIALALPMMARHLGYAGSRSQAVYMAVRNLGATRVAEEIARRDKHLPEELYALGLRAMWSGQLRVSRQLLERAVKAGGELPQLFTHLGNVRFSLGDRDGALRAYQDALARDPEHVIAHFNMSRVHYARAEHQKAGVAHRRASAIDFQSVERYAREAKQAGRAYVAPEVVPRQLLSLPYSSDRVQRRAVEQAWTWLAAGTPRLTFGFLAIIAALLLGAMEWIRRPLRLAAECRRCGSPACEWCAPEMPDKHQCGQCYHAFVAEDSAVDPQLKIRKEIEAHRHSAAQVRMRRLISLLMAGGGHILRGAPLRGLLFLALFATCLIGVLGSIGVIPSPALVPDARLPGISAVVSGFCALSVYVVALWDGSRES